MAPFLFFEICATTDSKIIHILYIYMHIHLYKSTSSFIEKSFKQNIEC